MKNLFLAIVLLFSFSFADVSSGVDFSIKSSYLNRGTTFESGLASNTGTPVLWSDAWISNNGFTGTIWTSSMIQDSLHTNEVDIITNYSKEVFGIQVGIGLNYYTFPNSSEDVQVSSTGEFTFSVAKTIGHFTLGVNGYQDYIMSKGFYVTPSVKSSWSLSDFTFNTNTSIGWAENDFMFYNRGIDAMGVTDITLDLEAKYNVPFHKNLTIGLDIHDAYQPDIKASNNVGWQQFVVGGRISYAL